MNYTQIEAQLLDDCVDASNRLREAWNSVPYENLAATHPERYRAVVTAHNEYAACVQRLNDYYAQRKAA
jgi:hypothetical protein